jgi:DNA-binding CsgD family transcriptional regulator
VDESRAVVLLGDAIRSRRARVETAAWLRDLAADLDSAYGDRELAPFGFAQGDEIQGLLRTDADPLVAVLRSALTAEARPMRWVCIWGCIDPGQGPATAWTGSAFVAAREAIETARTARERLVLRTGEQAADELLTGMTPALMDLLDRLTPHQRVVARMALIDGLRQAEVAEKLGIRRATVSVAWGRARVNSIDRLAAAVRKTFGAAAAEASATPAAGAAGTADR